MNSKRFLEWAAVAVAVWQFTLPAEGQSCASMPPGIVSWWRAENNAEDAVSGHDGSLNNGATFVIGEVGQAFHFDGVDDYVEVPDSPDLSPHVGPNGQMTLQAWVKIPQLPAQSGQSRTPVASKADFGNYEYALYVYSSGQVGFSIWTLGGNGYAEPRGGSISLDTWHLVTGTMAKGQFVRIYLDGVLLAETTSFYGDTADGASSFFIGRRGYDGQFFNGDVDEVQLFNRALSTAEIEAIYNAGPAGVCTTECVAPLITTQPSSLVVCPGGSATFTVQAAGTGPFSYQWSRDGVDISGATDSSLIVSPAEAGEYRVLVSNACGQVESDAATLTVADSPPVVTLNGAASVFVEACTGTYLELGAVANDTCDGPLSVTISGDAVNTDQLGTYLVIYSATDSSGQTTTATRTVIVQDTQPPVFTTSPADLTLSCTADTQTTLDAWLASAVATDTCGPVTVTHTVDWTDPCEAGQAVVTWTATDSHGLTATTTANLTVEPDRMLTNVQFPDGNLSVTVPRDVQRQFTVMAQNSGPCPAIIQSAQIAASFSTPVVTVSSPVLPATICPMSSKGILLAVDTTGAVDGVYSATLTLAGPDGGTRSLPIEIVVSGQLLPDITANYTGGGVSIAPDSSQVFPATGEGFTINATVKNIGSADADAFSVKFFEGTNLLGTAAVAGLAMNQSTTAQFAVPNGFAEGWYLIRAEVVAPASGELQLKNNNASALLQVGAPPVASASVRITGSVTPDCSLTAGTLSIHAEYVLVTGDSSVTYPMQGAYVTATIVGTALGVSGEHTDVNGNLTTSVGLPAAGTYSVEVEATDFTVTGQETLALVVPSAPNCVQGGEVSSSGASDPIYPAESVDLFICSDDIAFRDADGVTPLTLPATSGESVQICATVHYYTSAGSALNAQPVNFVARRQVDGAVQELFIGTALANFAGGGTTEVCVPWTVPSDGTYSILVSLAPNVSQGTANDQATRGFVVGVPPSPDMVLQVTAEGAGCGGSGQWVSGRATYATIGAPALPVICGHAHVTAYDSNGNLVGTSGEADTDAAGNFYFRPGISLPNGVNTMVVQVTDGTLTGSAQFTIECQPTENVPAPTTPPLAQGDLYLFAEDIAFLSPDCLSALNRNPLPGEAISVNANIHYWDNNSSQPLSAVPVDVNVLIPSGDTLLTVPVGSTTVDFDAGGSEVICVPWTPTVTGPQILQVVIDPNSDYSFPFSEYAGNNAATKLIYVGQLGCLLTADLDGAQVHPGGSADYTIKGETLSEGNPTLQLSVVSDSPLVPPGVTYSLGVNQMTLPGETTLTLTTTTETPLGTYYFNVVGTGDNCSAIARVKLEVKNTPPVVTIEQPASGFLAPVGQTIQLLGTFTDDGPAGSHTAEWVVSSGSAPATTIPGTVTDFTVSDSISFSEPGIYSIKLVVTDAEGASGEATTVLNDLPAYVVVYDPEGGFVTGGGWIWSPPGAFHPGLEEFGPVEGKANFGFVARYQQGATTPTGQTEFQFRAGDLNFHSSSYQWLVVSGARAQFKGTGTINGEGDFGFLLTAVDGQVNGGGGQDRFRIKIWDIVSGVVIYDNQAGTDDDAALSDATILRGGSIVIHQ